MPKSPVFEYTSELPTIFSNKGHEISEKDTILCAATITGLIYQFGDGITQWRNIETYNQFTVAIKFADIYHKPAVDHAIRDFCTENNINDSDFENLKYFVYNKLFSLYKNNNEIHLYYDDYKKITLEEFETFIKNNTERRCDECKLCIN